MGSTLTYNMRSIEKHGILMIRCDNVDYDHPIPILTIMNLENVKYYFSLVVDKRSGILLS